tara:strand:+ start:837 stop:1112 length:276 start_codon:yes stop_codon:yes gene_type:complete
MKTVIVFDTEDVDGMKSAVAIIDHLANKYLPHHKNAKYTYGHQTFGKIEFIKEIREFAKHLEKDFQDWEDRTSLKTSKHYTDKLWQKKSEM